MPKCQVSFMVQCGLTKTNRKNDTYGRRTMDIRSRPLPQGPLLAASNRSKSTSGSAKFPTQFHLHCERHMLTTNAREAFVIVPRIEMTAFRDSGNLVHFEMGSRSYTKSRITRAAKDNRLRRSDPSSNDHTEKISRNLLGLPFGE